MNIAVSVKNNTDYTPTLELVELTNAEWVEHFELRNGQSIAPNGQVAGLMEATAPFSGTLTVRYTFVAPGPKGADVVVAFDGSLLEEKLLIGSSATSNPGTAFPNSSAQPVRDGEDWYLLVEVR
jgi:hypothetical protein